MITPRASRAPDPVEDIDDVLPQHGATGRDVSEAFEGALVGQRTIEETGERFPVRIELRYVEGSAELSYGVEQPGTTLSTGAGAASTGASTGTGTASPEAGSEPAAQSSPFARRRRIPLPGLGRDASNPVAARLELKDPRRSRWSLLTRVEVAVHRERVACRFDGDAP